MTALARLSIWTALVFLLIASTAHEVDGLLAEISTAFAVIKFTKSLVGDLGDLWKKLTPKDGPRMPWMKSDDEQVLNTLDSIKARLERTESSILQGQQGVLLTIANNVPRALRQELRLDSLLRTLRAISRQERIFKALNGTTALARLSEAIGPDLWIEVGDMLAPQYGNHLPPTIYPRSILSTIAEGMKQEHLENYCNIYQSPKQLLYNLYNSLQMSQLKAYTLMQFSLLYRKVRDNNTDYTEESQAYQTIYEEYLTRQAYSLKEVLKGASEEYWRCDPKDHIMDETYTTLKKFLQGYLQNEVDMNPSQGCWENCDYYKVTKQYSCFKDTYCSQQTTCQGQLVNCKFVDSDMWVCPSGGGRNQNRRYEWIKYENGRTLGQMDGSCRRGVAKVDSWWRYLMWHCSYCFCICDEVNSPFTERYFSLKTVTSDVANNKVLTGIKMVKEDKIIHLQGQESELLPAGIVNASSTQWIPIEKFSTMEGQEGIDYHTVSWEKRAVDLDDLLAPNDHILTGIRWRTLGSHLNFEIQVCKFNFETGKLEQGGKKCEWLSNDNTDVSDSNPRQRLKIESPDLPIRIRVPSQLISSSDKYIVLTHSDEVADASQTAVPFFDLQAVAPDPPVPLKGAGMGYKGLIRSGGFITPKVFTLDPIQHITTDFTVPKIDR